MDSHTENDTEITGLHQQVPKTNRKCTLVDKTANKDLWSKTGQEHVIVQMCRREWNWLETRKKRKKGKEEYLYSAFIPVSYTHLTLPTKRIV